MSGSRDEQRFMTRVVLGCAIGVCVAWAFIGAAVYGSFV